MSSPIQSTSSPATIARGSRGGYGIASTLSPPSAHVSTSLYAWKYRYVVWPSLLSMLATFSTKRSKCGV